jgi:probable nitrogen fixation protein
MGAMRATTEAPQEGSFLEHLVRALQGADEGAGPGADRFAVLGPLLVQPPERAESAAIDPEAFWRVEAFFRAVGAAIEGRTGVPCMPMMRMRRGGFGIAVLIAGRLVVVSGVFRDASAFRFESLDALAAAGERLVREGTELIERHPEIARAGRWPSSP